MSMQDRLDGDLKAAMKAGDEARKRTIRGIKTAIARAETAGEIYTALDDAGVLTVIAKEAKQRRESIAEFERAGRNDLVEEEKKELAILESYLPQQMEPEEIRNEAQAVITEMGSTGTVQFGTVMKVLMGKLRSRADGQLVQQIVRELLYGSDTDKV